MKIAWSVGHSEKIRGMRGSPVPPQCDEVDECLKISTSVCELLTANGVEAPMFFDTTSTSQSQYLDAQVRWTNQQNADLGVQCHLNAGGSHTNPVGCEVWYHSQESLARKVATAMANALHLPDRGPKYTSSLTWVMQSDPPCILLECFFGDSTADCNAYRANYDALVTALAESISGIDMDTDIEEPPERPPIEPPQLPPSDDNYVEMKTASTGEVKVFINGQLIHGEANDQHVIDITLVGHGDVAMEINGEMFHSVPPPIGGEGPPETTIPSNQTNIICTVFGGDADGEYSAYGPYDSQGRGPYLNDDDDYVSLPWTVEGAGLHSNKRLKIWNVVNGTSVVCTVADKGPWYVDDNYVKLGKRPLAEQQYLAHQPCDHGPNEGTIPNGAGIDISPHAANVLDIDGKGKVNWDWVEPETV